MVYVKMVNTLLVSEPLTSLSTSVGRWRRWRDQGPGNLNTAQRRPPLTGLHVRFIRSVSLKMLNVDHLGCADSIPLSESKNGFLIRDLPDFAVEKNVKSVNWICDLGNLLQTRAICMTAWASQEMTCFLLFDKLCDYTVQNFVVGSSNNDDGT